MTKILVCPPACFVNIWHQRTVYPRLKEILILIMLLLLSANYLIAQSECENDNIPPFFTYVAGDAFTECNLPTPVIAAKAQDNCTEVVTITQSIDTIFNGCPQSYILFITHTATDEQGNSVSAQQVVQIIDTNPPLLWGIPSDTAVFCSSIPEPPELSTWDNCGEVTVTLTESVIDEPGCWSFLYRNWVASDECGNSTTGSQILSVYDDLAPVLVDPPIDMTVECDSIPEAGIIATDACSMYLTYDLTETMEDGDCPNEFTITRTWLVSDDCDNSVTHTYVITVIDTSPPEFVDLVSELSIECPAEPEFETPALFDCGSDLQVSYSDTTIQGECPVWYSVTRTWTATDECGNTSTAEQTIHVVDTNPPVFVDPPSSLIVQCAEEIPPVPDIEYFDECGEIESVIFKENPLTDFCGEGLRRTWAVTDDCGNMAIYTQDIEVNDTTPPAVIYAPADTIISCEDVLLLDTAMFEDNCSYPITVELVSDTVGNGCPDPVIITNTWTANDMCGNASSYSQIITVVDTTPPEFIADFTNDTLSCENDSIPDIPDVSVIDNCDTEVEIIYNDTILPGNCSGAYSIVRTWTASDDCGNESQVVQTIEIIDDTPPLLVDFPNDTIHECDNVPGAAAGTILDCSSDITLLLSQFGWDGSCEGTYFRIWTVSDGCGNTSTHMQEMTIVDTTPPEFDGPLPEDMDVNCDSIPLASADDLTAFDNCGDAEVTFEEDAEPEDCENGYAITRTWTATDECGNTTAHTQVLNAQNIQAPIQEISERPLEQFSEAFDANLNPPDIRMEIIPNPTTDNSLITIISEEMEFVLVEVYDINGIKVSDVYSGFIEKDETYRFEFNGESMAPGIYLYRITSQKEVIIDKIVLTK